MSGSESLRASHVDDERAVLDEVSCVVHLERKWRRHTGREATHGRAVAVDLLHAREIWWRFRQIPEHGGNEVSFRPLLQEWVQPALLADGRMRRLSDAGPAERSCSVPRVDLDVVGKFQQRAKERVVQLFGKPARQVRTEQIRTAHGADEERVAGKDADRLIGLTDEERDVFRRVPRRVQ